MLRKSAESEQLCLVPDLRGNAFNISSLSMILAEGVSYISFTMLKYIPPIPNLLKVLFFVFLFFFLCFCLLSFVVVVAISWAAPAAYGGSQARG